MRLAINVSSSVPSRRKWAFASETVTGSAGGPLVCTRAIAVTTLAVASTGAGPPCGGTAVPRSSAGGREPAELFVLGSEMSGKHSKPHLSRHGGAMLRMDGRGGWERN